MLTRRMHRKPCAQQRGLSLVELLVGVAVGLFVVAGAATVTATHLSDSRQLVIEAQIQQDLRATADIMTREIRRAGQWNSASQSVWAPGEAVLVNDHDEVSQVGTADIAIERSTAAILGFQRASGSPAGVIQMNTGGGGWQPLTDPAVLDIQTLEIAIAPVRLNLSCSALCADATQACWPQIEVRNVIVSITGRAVNDPRVVRSVRSETRLRNDRVINNNAGGPLCPI